MSEHTHLDGTLAQGYGTDCWNCGAHVCGVNMYGMGTCKECGELQPKGRKEQIAKNELAAKLAKQKPQRQDSLDDQIKDLIPIAEQEGMYDAADWLKSLFVLRETEAKRRGGNDGN